MASRHGVAHPARVTEDSGEATILSVRDGIHDLTVNKVDGPQMFRVTSDPGHLGALHTTSVGKALVAFADDAACTARRRAAARSADRLSITDREAFRAEIEKIRRQGYATMDEENELGMRAVAVPVFNSQGHAFASLATAVPVFRLAWRPSSPSCRCCRRRPPSCRPGSPSSDAHCRLKPPAVAGAVIISSSFEQQCNM